jgi:hypothetical protein
MNRVQALILRAVAYHDLFDFPMTVQEIHAGLPGDGGPRVPFEEVVRALDAPGLHGRLGRLDGLHFLAGREALVGVRKDRFDLAEGKYRRARSFLRLARFAPFLRAAAVCNTLARSNARSGSDIDLYLVAASGRVWLTRLFVTGLAALLGVRPTEGRTRDRLCLSFFVAEEALDLKPLAVEDDIYLAHWLQELYPVYDEACVFRRSFVENRWLRDVLPGARVQAASHRRAVAPAPPRFKRVLERFIEAVGGDRLERWARDKQLRWLPERLKQAALRGTGVVLTDTVLKFHDEDRREEIRERYRVKLDVILGPDMSSRASPSGETRDLLPNIDSRLRGNDMRGTGNDRQSAAAL